MFTKKSCKSLYRSVRAAQLYSKEFNGLITKIPVFPCFFNLTPLFSCVLSNKIGITELYGKRIAQFATARGRYQKEGYEIYVSNLDPEVQNHELKRAFEQIGGVQYAKTRVVNGECFGYVYFKDESSAIQAVSTMNGKSIRKNLLNVKISHLSDVKLFEIIVRNLPKSVSKEGLTKAFEGFGEIVGTYLISDKKSQDVNHAYVHYANEKAAIAAIVEMNGHVLDEKEMDVKASKNSNLKLYEIEVTNVDGTETKESIRTKFEGFGDIIGIYSYQDKNRSNNNKFFINFLNEMSAIKAIIETNSELVEGKKMNIQASRNSNIKSYEIIVRKLYTNINVDDILKAFSPFGDILGIDIQDDMHLDGHKVAYVKFLTEESAVNALLEMDSKEIQGDIISVNASNYSNITSYEIQISNIDTQVSEAELRTAFEVYGKTSKLFLHYDTKKTNTNHAYLSFFSKEAAVKAIQEMDGQFFNMKRMRVHFRSKSVTETYQIVVNNLDNKLTERELRNEFKKFGDIIDILIIPDSLQKGAVVVYIDFINEEDARSTIQKLNNKTIFGRTVTVKKTNYGAFYKTSDEVEGTTSDT